jgi:hypothetical protein
MRGFPAKEAGHPLWGRGILALRQGLALHPFSRSGLVILH